MESQESYQSIEELPDTEAADAPAQLDSPVHLLKIDYKDVVLENRLGESVSAIPIVARVCRGIYGATAKYNFLVVFLSGILAIFWGIMAATVGFFVTWILHPPSHIFLTGITSLAGFYRTWLLCLMEPCYIAVSFGLSRIKANITLRSWPSLL
eukprot:m.170176 g.170176  ORF g.170176 m.170176 type:complete len:153 (+) comp39031_c0_seq3:764-1222(+)